LFNSDPVVNSICDAIYHALKLILLRIHAHQASIRTKDPKSFSELKPLQTFKPPLLQGVVELFQYYLFVNKLEKHIKALSTGLEEAGIEVFLRMNRLGETAEELIEVFATSYINEDQKKRYFGGEVILRIAQQYAIHSSHGMSLNSNSFKQTNPPFLSFRTCKSYGTLDTIIPGYSFHVRLG
jgi:hypothetical protein